MNYFFAIIMVCGPMIVLIIGAALTDTSDYDD
jgi:hypothetical protein